MARVGDRCQFIADNVGHPTDAGTRLGPLALSLGTLKYTLNDLVDEEL